MLWSMVLQSDTTEQQQQWENEEFIPLYYWKPELVKLLCILLETRISEIALYKVYVSFLSPF